MPVSSCYFLLMSLLRCGTTHLAGLSCFPLESPFPRYAPAAAISQDLVFPSLRGLASAVYFLIISLGALAPLFVGALNGWFDMKAPYQDEEEPQVPKGHLAKISQYC